MTGTLKRLSGVTADTGALPEIAARQLASVLVVRLGFEPGRGDLGDPDDAFSIGEWRDRLIEQAKQLGGEIVERHADGFVVLFDVFHHLEHHATHACTAALRIREGLKASRDRRSCGPLLARASVHSGVVMCLHDATGTADAASLRCATGATGELALALAAVTPDDSIYLTHATYRLLGATPQMGCRPVGERKLGSETLPVYVIDPAGHRDSDPQTRGRPLLPFVDRTRELDRMLERVDALGESHTGAVLCLTGETGIGKTRLIRRAAALRAGVQAPPWVLVQGASYAGDDLYRCLRSAFAQLLGLPLEHSAERARATAPDWETLVEACRRLMPEDGAETARYLGLVLGVRHLDVKLDADKLRHQILRTSYRLVRTAAERRPLVIVLDDAQWIDAASLGVFEHLVSLADLAPILFVVSTNDPTHRRLRALLTTDRASGHDTDVLRLSPLEDDAVQSVLMEVIAPQPQAQDLITDLTAKAAGNPLFIAETIESLIEHRVLAPRNADGRLDVLDPEAEVTLPDTVENVILCRLRALDSPLRQVLAIASVIGGRFPVAMLADILSPGDTDAIPIGQMALLAEQLDTLAGRGLLIRWGHGENCRYEVSDPFVQETAYRTLPRGRLHELHRRCGRYLERLPPDQRQDQASELARHFWAARDWSAAQRYLPQSGDRAYAVAADREAAISYAQAIRSYQRVANSGMSTLQQAVLERRLGELSVLSSQIRRGLVHFDRASVLLGMPVQRTRARVRFAIIADLARQIAHRIAPALFVRRPRDDCTPIEQERIRLFDAWIWALYTADQERLILLILRMLHYAERIGHREGQEKGYLSLCFLCANAGLFGPAQRYLDLFEAIVSPQGAATTTGFAAHLRGLYRLMRGDCAPAERDFRDALDRAETSGEHTILAAAGASVSLLWQGSGNLAAAMRTGAEMVSYGREARLYGLIHWGLAVQGGALLRGANLAKAEEVLRSTIDLAWDFPDYECLARCTGDLAECLLRQGRLADARQVLGSALADPGLSAAHGIDATYLHNAVLMLHLADADSAGTVHRGSWPGIAKALRRAKREARCYRPALPVLLRLEGSLAWLRGRQEQARRCWSDSVILADRQGANLEAANTYFEIARRTGDDEARRLGRLRMTGLALAHHIGVVR